MTSTIFHKILVAAPPLLTPHKDGWRKEHFCENAKDPACGAALANLMTAVVAGDVPSKTVEIYCLHRYSSSLSKKDAEVMEALKRQYGLTYVQPQLPIGMGTAIVKVASNCALLLVKDAMGLAVGPSKFAVKPRVESHFCNGQYKWQWR